MPLSVIFTVFNNGVNPLNAELNPICHQLALLGAHHIFYVSGLRVNWPEDGRLRPKHVAKYNLIIISASCLDVCCVLTVHNIL